MGAPRGGRKGLCMTPSIGIYNWARLSLQAALNAFMHDVLNARYTDGGF